MTAPTGPPPTPPATPAPSPPPAVAQPAATSGRIRLGPIITYTLRSCIGGKRLVGIALPCVGIVLFGLLALAVNESSPQAFADVATEAIYSLMLPIATLVIGDAVLGAEMRSGVLHFTWLSPTSLGQIVLGRWLAASMVALVSIVPATALAAVVAADAGDAGAAALAAAVGAVAYLAVFIAIGCVARRAAVWSLAAVFLVERLLGAALAGIAQWCPQWEARAVFVGLATDAPNRLVRAGIPGGTDAIVRLAVVTAAALWVARWRLAHIRLSGAAD
jgi:ABC-2 type transport system permease protein